DAKGKGAKERRNADYYDDYDKIRKEMILNNHNQSAKSAFRFLYFFAPLRFASWRETNERSEYP
ncbi:MAG: hypothetical protein ACXWV9_06050, partial [Flavisolibacter sp.]